jgi:hypothetical protein
MQRTTSAAVFFGIALASPVALADPMSDLTKDKNDVCFRRDYDAAHLKKNPRQQVTSMTVWIAGSGDMRGGNTGLALTRRSDPQPIFLSGDCSWGNFEGPPVHWMPSFTKKVGAGCVTLAVPDVFPEASSAEEGGAVILDPAPDGKTMIVHLDDSPSMVTRARRWKPVPLKLGRDDRVFLLRRTALKDCEFVKEAVTVMEPPLKERQR